MVDVGSKPVSRRRATAAATVTMAEETARRLGDLPKGDALATAQLAGIMAAKRTAELIPLCHPLPLTVVDVRLEGEGDRQGDDRHGHPAGGEDEGAVMKAAVLTVSDGVSQGTREDRSGDLLAE